MASIGIRSRSAANTRRRKRLREALGSVLWPYYFVRVEEENREQLVTWMPNYEQMGWSCEGLREDDRASRSLGMLLYPSVAGCLPAAEGATTEDRVLGHLLKHWLDLGYMDLEDETAKGFDVGHVQPLSRLPPRGYVHEDEVAETAHERSRFSDAFYLIDSAFYLRDVACEQVLGRVIWCSPLKAFLPRLAQGRGEHERLGRLAEMSQAAWHRVRGQEVAADLRDRFRTTNRLLTGTQEWAGRLAFQSIRHGVMNILDKGLPPDAGPTELGRALTLVRLLSEAGALIAGSKPEVLRWSRSGFQKESIGTTICEWLSGRRFRVELAGEELIDEVDARFVALLFELLRNAEKNRAQDSEVLSVAISPHPLSRGAISIGFSTSAIRQDVLDLRRRLEYRRAGTYRGVALVCELAKHLLDGEHGRLSWIFSDGEGPLQSFPEQPGFWRIEAPASVWQQQATAPHRLRLDCSLEAVYPRQPETEKEP